MERLWVDLLAQTAPASGTGGNTPAGNFWQQLLFSPLTMVAVLILLFYTIVLGPERKKAAETARLRDSLKKNDWIVTVGGICGKVVSVAENEEVVICIDESNGTRMRILRSAIATVRSSDTAAANA
jgi:preprotein translocase subunit YajC